GVPLTIIGAQTGWGSFKQWFLVILKGLKVFLLASDYPKFLILEMGVDRPKDMERMVSWIKPYAAVITAAGTVPVHVQYFSGPEELISEKRKLVECLDDNNWAVLNIDDKTVANFRKNTKARIITYGFSESADLTASNYKMDGEGIVFKVNYKGNIVPVRLDKFFGRHNVYIILAAIGAGLACGINLVKSVEAVSKMKPPLGRMNLLEGMNGSLIFDDSYNSSPLAVEAAVEVLSEYPAKRRIAVLGDMKELGAFSQSEHERIGETLRAKDVWFLFAVGQEAKFIAEGARRSGFDSFKIFEFSNSSEAEEAVKSIIQEGDLILVKGSQSARMERAVESIMAHPEDKDKLLVRQEEEWKNR
ncbi:MAG: UDP-N-acetylmuramoyl-tripeptide-D-alanyl-D-alanine ligase, partial [Parcubacteria group bacterium GW2011_GWB1_43_8]